MSLCVCMYIIARQWLGINVPMAMNTHATIELLDTLFYMQFVSYPRRVCGSVYPPVVARQWLSKHIPVTTKNCWRHSFLRLSVIHWKCRTVVINGQIYIIVTYYVDHVASKESSCLVLRRTSCFKNGVQESYQGHQLCRTIHKIKRGWGSIPNLHCKLVTNDSGLNVHHSLIFCNTRHTFKIGIKFD
jgi:hypothetical protein